MKTLRRVHLWTGVVIALFLLVQSVTGLVLSNSRPAGQGPPWAQPGFATSIDNSSQLSGPGAVGPGFQGRRGFPERSDGQRNTFFATVRELHGGRIGNYDFSLLLDVAALGFILVTVTGLILAYKVLKGPRSKLTTDIAFTTTTTKPGDQASGTHVEITNQPDSTGKDSGELAHHPEEEKSDETK